MTLKFKNVGHNFIAEEPILKDINLIVKSGDLVKISGGNGAGKTTFLRIASSHLWPQTGHVELNNVDFKKNAKTYRSQISWLHSDGDGFFPRLTGEENLKLFFYYRAPQWPLEEAFQRWSALPIFKKALETQLYLSSSGMKQILGLFRCLETPAKFYLLDEPARSLDLLAQEFLEVRLKELLSHSGQILTSHSEQLFTKIITQDLRLENAQLH